VLVCHDYENVGLVLLHLLKDAKVCKKKFF
jgi:hypothetical protein